jgi:hypothetical protein
MRILISSLLQRDKIDFLQSTMTLDRQYLHKYKTKFVYTPLGPLANTHIPCWNGVTNCNLVLYIVNTIQSCVLHSHNIRHVWWKSCNLFIVWCGLSRGNKDTCCALLPSKMSTLSYKWIPGFNAQMLCLSRVKLWKES